MWHITERPLVWKWHITPCPQVSNLLFSDLESDSSDFTHGFILALLFTNLYTILDRFFLIDYCGHKLVVPVSIRRYMLRSYYSYTHNLSSPTWHSGPVLIPVPMVPVHMVPYPYPHPHPYLWSRTRTRTRTNDFVTCRTRTHGLVPVPVPMVSNPYPYPWFVPILQVWKLSAPVSPHISFSMFTNRHRFT